MKDPYSILGVSHDADLETIKRAFHKKAKETHPDLNSDNHNAAAEFRDVVDAYALLSNEVARKQYDDSIRTESQDYSYEKDKKYEQSTDNTQDDAFGNVYNSSQQDDYQNYYYNMYAQLADIASDALGKLFGGLICIVVGACFSLGTYIYAYINGGTYTMWYGIIAIGVLGLITGIYRYSKIRNAMKEFEKNML